MNLHEALQHPGRLAALRQTVLLDTPTEEAFDRLTRLAVTVFNAPTVLVSLVDADRQFFKSCVGLPEPWSSARQTPLSHSFCQHTIVSGEPLVIDDARQHPLVRENLAIRDLGVVAYLGIPLLTALGHVLGTFCIIDAAPRAWTPAEVSTAQDLAASVITEIELRAARADLEQQVATRTEELRAANRRLRADRRQLQELSRRLVNVQEAERQQLARELHDEIGQLLTGLKLSLEMSQRLHGDALLEHLRVAQHTVSSLMQQVRELSLQLRPSMLDDLGLLPTLRWYVERYTVTSGVRVAFEQVRLDRSLPPDVTTAAYRIVQEALTNVARHAGIDEVTVRCSVDDAALHIRIEDQGKGFRSEQARTSRGFGLTSMRERATHMGGDLRVDSAPGAGTCLVARLPFGIGVPQERRYDDDSAGR